MQALNSLGAVSLCCGEFQPQILAYWVALRLASYLCKQKASYITGILHETAWAQSWDLAKFKFWYLISLMTASLLPSRYLKLEERKSSAIESQSLNNSSCSLVISRSSSSIFHSGPRAGDSVISITDTWVTRDRSWSGLRAGSELSSFWCLLKTVRWRTHGKERNRVTCH